jgi:hypothetical protein
LQQLTTNNRKTSKGEIKMSDQENRNPQHSDPQKPGSEQKPGNQPNQPIQHKQQDPSGQPKSPQSEQEKHDQEKKKQA